MSDLTPVFSYQVWREGRRWHWKALRDGEMITRISSGPEGPPVRVGMYGSARSKEAARRKGKKVALKYKNAYRDARRREAEKRVIEYVV